MSFRAAHKLPLEIIENILSQTDIVLKDQDGPILGVQLYHIIRDNAQPRGSTDYLHRLENDILDWCGDSLTRKRLETMGQGNSLSIFHVCQTWRQIAIRLSYSRNKFFLPESPKLIRLILQSLKTEHRMCIKWLHLNTGPVIANEGSEHTCKDYFDLYQYLVSDMNPACTFLFQVAGNRLALSVNDNFVTMIRTFKRLFSSKPENLSVLTPTPDLHTLRRNLRFQPDGMQLKTIFGPNPSMKALSYYQLPAFSEDWWFYRILNELPCACWESLRIADRSPFDFLFPETDLRWFTYTTKSKWTEKDVIDAVNCDELNPGTPALYPTEKPASRPEMPVNKAKWLPGRPFLNCECFVQKYSIGKHECPVLDFEEDIDCGEDGVSDEDTDYEDDVEVEEEIDI